MTPGHGWTLIALGVLAAVACALPHQIQQADAQVITYKMHPDILVELQDRYPEHAQKYWGQAKAAIRDAVDEWATLNPDLIFTPSHEGERHDVVIEWIDSERVWGVEYHDAFVGHRIGIDFDAPEPDEYGASLMNPDIVRYVTAHEIGHLLGMGHSADYTHLMYGESNPDPDRVFDDRGYEVPTVTIENFGNVGGGELDVLFHLQGYHVYDVGAVDVNGTQYVVAATGSDGIHMLDVSDPQNVRPAGVYDAESYSIKTLGEWPYVALPYSDGIALLDVSDPGDIVLADFIEHRSGNPILNTMVAEADGKPVAVTLADTIIQQYDLSDPYNVQRTGSYFDDYMLLSVRAMYGIIHEDATYALVAGPKGDVMKFRISGDRNPAHIGTSDPAFDCDDHVRTVVEVGDSAYLLSYMDGQIRMHEILAAGESDPRMLYQACREVGNSEKPAAGELDPVGKLLGYRASEIAAVRAGGAVYAVVAAGPDGILGIHVGDEGASKWTLG